MTNSQPESRIDRVEALAIRNTEDRLNRVAEQTEY